MRGAHLARTRFTATAVTPFGEAGGGIARRWVSCSEAFVSSGTRGHLAFLSADVAASAADRPPRPSAGRRNLHSLIASVWERDARRRAAGRASAPRNDAHPPPLSAGRRGRPRGHSARRMSLAALQALLDRSTALGNAGRRRLGRLSRPPDDGGRARRVLEGRPHHGDDDGRPERPAAHGARPLDASTGRR